MIPPRKITGKNPVSSSYGMALKIIEKAKLQLGDKKQD
jgi:hypothetical protein